MTTNKDRAVAVVVDAGEVLVIVRHRDGRDYVVLPGGGVEAGEEPAEAALRELAEETGLVGQLTRHLWSIPHGDRIAHYYLVSVERGPLTLGGPEALAQSGDNRYAGRWVNPARLDALNLQPAEIRPLVARLASGDDG